MGDTYLNRPAYVLGRPSPVCGASIGDSDATAAEFAADGYTQVHRSTSPCWRLAADAASRAMAAVGYAGARPDLSIYCTETWFEMMPTEALSRFVAALGVGTSRALAVGGHTCANFVSGVDVASREIAGGRSTVLVATVDRVADGRSRSFRDGLALLSDGAAAALVSDRPLGDGYRVLAVAHRSSSTIDDDGRDRVDVRVSIGDVRESVAEVLDRVGAERSDVRWLVTNNYRTASNDFLVRTAGLADVPRARPAVEATAHCFAGDAAIVLSDLVDGRHLADGDLVLVLGSGGRSRIALLLGAHLAGTPRGPLT